jgi:hypothetical protein
VQGLIRPTPYTYIHTYKEVGLEVNAEETKYMLLSRHQNAGQNHDIKIANRCFENAAQLRYLGTTVMNQNLIQEEIKRRLNSGNACCHSVQNLLSPHLLSKNVKIRMHKTIILPMVLYGCETCSLTLKEEHRMRVFESRVLRRIFGPKRMTGDWRRPYNEELHNLYSSSIIRMIKPRRMKWTGRVARMGAKRNAYGISVEKPEGNRPLGRPRRRWVDNIKMDYTGIEWGGMDWIDLAEDRDQ